MSEQHNYSDGIRTVPIDDADYPPLLKKIHRPPPVLYVRGDIPSRLPMVAVVGTRQCTDYGRAVAERFATDLARAYVCVVSGLAYGIDSIAHAAALSAGGKTLAVLGAGVDRAHITPRAHVRLSDDIIASGGAVLSEYPPGFKATNYSFPARNRVIAGLSLATVVVEAPAESGALITAHCALEENREVFAVPQNIFSETAAGVHRLLAEGAQVATSAKDILVALGLRVPESRQLDETALSFASPLEEKIFAILSVQPIHIDFIAREIREPSAAVGSALTRLEISGIVQRLPGMRYVRSG